MASTKGKTEEKIPRSQGSNNLKQIPISHKCKRLNKQMYDIPLKSSEYYTHK